MPTLQLHFAEPEAFHDIYTHGVKFTKDYRLYRAFHQDTSSFGNIDPQQAKIRREMVIGLFSRRAIQKLEPVVRGVVSCSLIPIEA